MSIDVMFALSALRRLISASSLAQLCPSFSLAQWQYYVLQLFLPIYCLRHFLLPQPCLYRSLSVLYHLSLVINCL
jgi:hypothetical protein